MAEHLVPWLLFAVGIATQVVALLLLRRPLRLFRAGGTALGRVVANEETMFSRELMFFPVVEFTTGQGQSIRFTSESGRRIAHAKGSSVRVLYDPARPHDASLATFATLGMPALVTSLFGLPFVMAGCIVIF
jgi:hypothetical protein